MVQALVVLSDNTNRVLNMVKAKYGLKDKSQAIEYVVQTFIEQQKEPEFTEEFIERVRKAEKGKFIKIDNFAKHFGLE